MGWAIVTWLPVEVKFFLKYIWLGVSFEDVTTLLNKFFFCLTQQCTMFEGVDVKISTKRPDTDL